MKKATFTIIFVTLILSLTLILSPFASSISNNPCARCHETTAYYQYLDIIGGAAGNQIPSTLNLNQTATVTVVIQNSCNAPTFSTLSETSATLNSVYGHFSVNNPTFNIGDMQAGNITVTWQITSVSEGFDYLEINANAVNPHYNVPLSDTYFPFPLLTVGQPTGTPPPTPSPAVFPYGLLLQVISILAVIMVGLGVVGFLFKRSRRTKSAR